MNTVYLDNAATTKIDKRVEDVMFACFSEVYANASSMHSKGVTAKDMLNNARAQLAKYTGCHSDEIIFTSSGTEANNLALKGIAFANRHKGKHIIVSAIEHDCILNTCKWLQAEGFSISYLTVSENGIVDADNLKKCIRKDTILVSVMHVNNEIGTIQPIDELAAICKYNNIYFHTDACQSFGKIPVCMDNINLMTINSHKIYGPKGVGALIVKRATDIIPLLHGGGQENGLRSSTENLPAILGFVKAAELCMEEMESEFSRMTELQQKLINTLKNNIDGLYFNGDLKHRLPHNLNFCISGLEGESMRLLLLLDDEGIAVSSGSACSSNSGDSASHVLGALGLNPFEARGSIRISMGRYTTVNEIDIFTASLLKNINNLNSIFS